MHSPTGSDQSSTVTATSLPAPALEDGAASDLAAYGLDDFDAAAIIRSSTYCSMVHVAHQLGHEVAPGLTALDLSPTIYLVLGQVIAAPGSTPAELARRCGFLPQTMATVITTLEDRGLVRREGTRGRGRVTRLTITGQGIEALLAGWPVVHEAGADRLSETQHRTIQELLAALGGDAGKDDDVVVLADDDGHPVGTRPRSTVHTTDTPLHLAFSTYFLDADGRVLLTRRALHKRTWPGVWTNAACGHLRPGESAAQAAARRVPEELGTHPVDLRTVLPEFRYRAVDASGIVENEICPVLVGTIDADALRCDPGEIAEHAWVSWEQLRTIAATTPFLLSPWCVAQVSQMGDRPW